MLSRRTRTKSNKIDAKAIDKMAEHKQQKRNNNNSNNSKPALKKKGEMHITKKRTQNGAQQPSKIPFKFLFTDIQQYTQHTHTHKHTYTYTHIHAEPQNHRNTPTRTLHLIKRPEFAEHVNLKGSTRVAKPVCVHRTAKCPFECQITTTLTQKNCEVHWNVR